MESMIFFKANLLFIFILTNLTNWMLQKYLNSGQKCMSEWSFFNLQTWLWLHCSLRFLFLLTQYMWIPRSSAAVAFPSHILISCALWDGFLFTTAVTSVFMSSTLAYLTNKMFSHAEGPLTGYFAFCVWKLLCMKIKEDQQLLKYSN